MTTDADPPAHLSDAAAAWWRAVLTDYDLAPHHFRLLQLAGEAWDRTQEARQLLDREGLVVTTGDGGVKAHPAVAIERDSRLAFARLVRELDLDRGEPAPEMARPPALASNRG